MKERFTLGADGRDINCSCCLGTLRGLEQSQSINSDRVVQEQAGKAPSERSYRVRVLPLAGRGSCQDLKGRQEETCGAGNF
ncbi:hypothetical protein NDU88_004607 [Pleurodeles waltl]|uniref:Uncharacterized protein n=1 Tax=Pleurodeles waltl TaxID=8319 RepID=A0AAV7M7Y9_PLEWA|nr:hypothetical protein NDU88_004607 [Pleurodeles waltl]